MQILSKFAVLILKKIINWQVFSHLNDEYKILICRLTCSSDNFFFKNQSVIKFNSWCQWNLLTYQTTLPAENSFELFSSKHTHLAVTATRKCFGQVFENLFLHFYFIFIKISKGKNSISPWTIFVHVQILSLSVYFRNFNCKVETKNFQTIQCTWRNSFVKKVQS